MAAVCELDNCGVLTIGRCGTCRQAYCQSHVAYISRGPIVNLCASCQCEEEEARERAKEAKIERADQARKRIDQLVQILLEAEVPTEKYYDGIRLKKSIIFGERLVRDRSADKYGWLLGSGPWQISTFDGPATENYKTYITPQSEIVKEGGGTMDWNTGPTGAVARAYDIDTLGKKAAFWEGVAASLERLATDHGIDPQALKE